MWKWRSLRWQIAGGSYWTQHSMNYTFWRAGQPDNAQGSGREECVNIWPNLNFEWNDQPCSSQFCFVCENRNAPA